jgi:hypothetical protein
MTHNTVIIKKCDHDKFYTNPKIASELLSRLDEIIPLKDKLVIEPSAGNGSFLHYLKEHHIKYLALDLVPEGQDIIEQDFFDFVPRQKDNLVFVGNPPFGKNSSLAIKFFNHASKYAEVIAFIIPKTFRKIGTHDRLDLNFHLIKDIDTPKNCFLLKDVPYDVPCCFQIWVRKGVPRKKTPKVSIDYLTFTKDPSVANIAIRRVGGKAGRLETEHLTSLAYESYYFIIIDENIKTSFIEQYEKIDFQEIVNNTVGVKSLSKNELAIEIQKKVRF